MILSTESLSLEIKYSEKVIMDPEKGKPGDEYYTPENFHWNLHNVVCMNITKNMIPDILFVTKTEDYSNPYTGANMNWMYTLALNNGLLLEFKDYNIAEQILRIFTADFEGINLKDKHPELFL